jgi:hypothetical protein
MDRETIELLRAQLNAHAEELADRVSMVADALARAKGAVRRARRARARAEKVLGAIERAGRPPCDRGLPADVGDHGAGGSEALRVNDG